MELPAELKEAIEKEASSINLSELAKASQELTERYRNRTDETSSFMTSDKHRVAYAAARMPATYAAIRRVFIEVRELLPVINFESLLDLGSGPGTALWAASEEFETLKVSTLIEQDNQLISLGKRLKQASDNELLSNSQWIEGSLVDIDKFPEHDLVVLSYVIGEINPKQLPILIEKAWQAARKVLVIIEPGTMHGFQGIRQVRQQLIDLNSYIVAPCPHEKACPMPQNDWCHFSQRLERTFHQRQAKGAILGYEDEKFSYVVASRSPGTAFGNRILRHPIKHSGHLSLELCTSDGTNCKKTISRKQGELYKLARRLEWGDKIQV